MRINEDTIRNQNSAKIRVTLKLLILFDICLSSQLQPHTKQQLTEVRGVKRGYEGKAALVTVSKNSHQQSRAEQYEREEQTPWHCRQSDAE